MKSNLFIFMAFAILFFNATRCMELDPLQGKDIESYLNLVLKLDLKIQGSEFEYIREICNSLANEDPEAAMKVITSTRQLLLQKNDSSFSPESLKREMTNWLREKYFELRRGGKRARQYDFSLQKWVNPGVNPPAE